MSTRYVKSQYTTKKEPLLDDVLPTNTLRVDLILLVALCTDDMRDGLSSAFEKSQPETATPTEKFWRDDNSKISSARRKDMEWAQNLQLSSTEMQSLKTSMITHFNAWRTGVLRRMGEALNIKSDSVRRAKMEYSAYAESAKIAKNRQDYYSWAEGSESDDRIVDPEASTLPFKKVIAPASLLQVQDDKRALILGALLFILLSSGVYSAYSRVLLQFVSISLKLPPDVLRKAEATTAATLLSSVSLSTSQQHTDSARQQQAAANAQNRKWKIGLATVAGTLAIGITGGLAAPLILGVGGALLSATGLGGLATLLGATIANPVTVAALFGALGGSITGKAMEEYAKEVEDFKFLPVHEEATTSQPEHQLRVVIGISGWVTRGEDVAAPWKVFSSATLDLFALRYELEALIDLSTILDGVLKDSAYSVAQAGALQLVLPVLSAALMPVGLLKMGRFLDNPFSIAMERSDKAGRVLAHALIAKAQGERPITLVGFSLGARVMYSCLQELASHNAFGLVDSAVLIGSPIPSDDVVWRRMRSVVVGRIVNVYTKTDMLLGFLYRARNIQIGIAGLQAIEAIPGVENQDVSHIVSGHNQYKLAIGKILELINFSDIDHERVNKESKELEEEQTREKEVYDSAKRQGLLSQSEDQDGRIIMADFETFSRQDTFNETNADSPLARTTDDLQDLQIRSEEVNRATLKTEHHTLSPRSLQALESKHAQSRSKHMQETTDENDFSDAEVADENEDEEEITGPIQMRDLDPEPEPDFESSLEPQELVKSSVQVNASPLQQPPLSATANAAENEKVRFGTSERGFNLTWTA